MFKKIISILLCFSLINFWIFPLYAQDNSSLGSAVSPLKQDQKAPFTGVLLSPQALAELQAETKIADLKLKEEIENSNKICKIESNYQLKEKQISLETNKKISQAQIDAKQRENQILLERLKKIEDTQISSTLLMSGGFIVGTVITVLVVFATNKAQK